MNYASFGLMPEGCIEQAQREIVEEFGFFADWTERYQYIIEAGRSLPEFPEAWRTEDAKLKGCQSQVWIQPKVDGDRLYFNAVSDAAIVSGLIALLRRVYSGRTAQEILDSKPEFIADIGLAEHLSPTRSNGLHAMLNAIRVQAASVAAGGEPVPTGSIEPA